jgi:hypothetical protein
MERNSSGAPAAHRSSCDYLELLAPHHARLVRSCTTRVCWLPAVLRPEVGRRAADDAASDRASASGAAATFLSMRVCRRSAASHARLLALCGAAEDLAAFGRSTSCGAFKIIWKDRLKSFLSCPPSFNRTRTQSRSLPQKGVRQKDCTGTWRVPECWLLASACYCARPRSPPCQNCPAHAS